MPARPSADAQRILVAPRHLRPSAHAGLAADARGPHDSPSLGFGSLARYGEIGAGLLVLLLAAGALLLWRQDRGAEG